MLCGPAIKRKLIALQHPNAETISELDEEGFRTLVVWLENRKIRFYTEKDREPLASIKAKDWDGALLKYLDELGAGKPSCESEAAKAQIADWLASYAIGMEYSDKADKLCKVQTREKPAHVASPQAQPKADSKPAGVDVQMNVESPEFQEVLHKLADLLKVPRDDSPEAMLRQIANVLRTRLPPEAAPAPKPSAAAPSKKRVIKRAFDISDYPPGFDTGDATLNKAASLLRLLYVADLRRLQDRVNEIISQMQEYTANPKTDSSLGRVGR